jgi:spore maturation protein CgeB
MVDEGTIDLLFATSREKLEYFREQGYEAWLMPFGYHPSLGRLLGLQREVDVLFLGDTRPLRRRRQLRYLRRRGVDVTVRGSWHDRALWGESRTQFLNRTSIVLHLQRYPGKLAAMRLIMALANGAMVVSEPTYRPEPFVNGVHFVEVPVKLMPETIRYYLEHPAERERIVRAGHRLITEELTLTRSVEALLAVVNQRLGRSAPVSRIVNSGPQAGQHTF